MTASPDKRAWIVVNVVGGTLVLASYAWGAQLSPRSGVGMWGGVPESLQPLYTINMLLAAAGYLLFAQHLLRTDAAAARIGEHLGFGAFVPVFAAILFPSALWLPLTQAMLAAPSVGLFFLICVDLAVVGIASVALLIGLVRLAPHPGGESRALAIVGALPFAFQTAVLDAVVWPLYFPL